MTLPQNSRYGVHQPWRKNFTFHNLFMAQSTMMDGNYSLMVNFVWLLFVWDFSPHDPPSDETWLLSSVCLWSLVKRFEGISWSSDETFIAYVAEEPCPSKPTFNNLGYKSGNSSDKDCNSWKGQGDWEESWGETYVNKRRSTLFVINVTRSSLIFFFLNMYSSMIMRNPACWWLLLLCSGEVRAVEGIKRSLSAGQVLWAPATGVSQQQLIFVGWSSDSGKLGMKYCYNRPCALYAVCSPFHELGGAASDHRWVALCAGLLKILSFLL